MLEISLILVKTMLVKDLLPVIFHIANQIKQIVVKEKSDKLNKP